jgi:TPR repeat protein
MRMGSRLGLVVVGLLLATAPAMAQGKDKSASACDQLAANPYDPAVPDGEGVSFFDIDAPAAIEACEAAVKADPTDIKRVYQLGRANDVAENFPQAIQFYTQAADAAYAPAQNALGALYDGGYGVDADPAEAARYYTLAADGGYTLSMENLAKLYEDGRGVKQDYARAIALYRKAEAAGSAYASASLGWLAENGFGTPKDDVEALRLYRIGAEAGEAFALNNVGAFYGSGRGGVTQDYAEAVKYYQQAAEQGWPLAYQNLAWSYSNGQGIDRDLAKAEEYYNLAIAGDDAKVAGDSRNDLAWMFAMENTRLDEAEALAREAVAAGPEQANRLDTLAWILHLQGNNDEALPLAEQAVALDPSHSAFVTHLDAIKAAQ